MNEVARELSGEQPSQTPVVSQQTASSPPSYTKKQFSIMEAIQLGWNTFKTRPWFFIGISVVPFIISTVVPFAVQLLFTYVFRFDEETVNMLVGVVRFVVSILSFVIGIGVLRIFIESTEGKRPKFNEIFEPKGVFIQYVLLSIVVGALTFVGYLAFIIPGIIISLMLAFASYVLVSEKTGFVEAIQKSRQLTKTVRWKLLGLFIVVGILQFIGLLMLGVGIFVTGPVGSLAVAHVYHKLKDQTIYE
jgi:multisubunit Na+/H+ antiporter MnhG subunit